MLLAVRSKVILVVRFSRILKLKLLPVSFRLSKPLVPAFYTTILSMLQQRSEDRCSSSSNNNNKKLCRDCNSFLSVHLFRQDIRCPERLL
jgi:hypothetical protein